MLIIYLYIINLFGFLFEQSFSVRWELCLGCAVVQVVTRQGVTSAVRPLPRVIPSGKWHWDRTLPRSSGWPSSPSKFLLTEGQMADVLGSFSKSDSKDVVLLADGANGFRLFEARVEKYFFFLDILIFGNEDTTISGNVGIQNRRTSTSKVAFNVALFGGLSNCFNDF